jgi:hypothetical protein
VARGGFVGVVPLPIGFFAIIDILFFAHQQKTADYESVSAVSA